MMNDDEWMNGYDNNNEWMMNDDEWMMINDDEW